MLFLLWVMNSVTWPTTFPVHLLWALNKVPPVLRAHCLQGRCPIKSLCAAQSAFGHMLSYMKQVLLLLLSRFSHVQLCVTP